MKCGIVGLPNVGKSTLFNALTNQAIPAENYPFCTIDPNVGVVEVPDPRLKILSKLVNPERTQASFVEFVDIAGLVAGAASGEGLGNQFLAHIRETDAIIHVLRAFDDDNVVHVAGSVDPLRDQAIIELELCLADLSTVSKAMIKNDKAARAGDKIALLLTPILKKLEQSLNEGTPARRLNLSADEALLIKPLCLITAKPVLYVANLDEAGMTLFSSNIDAFLKTNTHYPAILAMAEQSGASVVPICAAMEAELSGMDATEKEVFLKDLGLLEPGLDRLIRAAFSLLRLHNYFTAGEKEVRSWTLHQGDTAQAAAGVIHTDFAKGFIRAEVIAFDDFIAAKSEANAKAQGKMRLEGKEYIVKDGDVMHFRFNV